VFDRVLKQFRKKVRARAYVMRVHAEEELDDDGLTVFDLERAVLTGTIVERQRDRLSGESKYVVNGTATDGSAVEVVVKLSSSGRLVIITIYRV
jgi:hypothetical protein